MNKAKFIGSLLFALLGAVMTFYPFSPTIPNQSELASADGTLISSRFRSRVGSEFKLEGARESFVYQSYGSQCGNVHEKLLVEVGKPISVKYQPVQNSGWFKSSNLLRVFEITGHQGTICSYEQVSAMIKGDFQWLPLIGNFILLAGLVSAFSAMSMVQIKNPANEKTWAALRADIEAEAGERIIGEQWKNPSSRSTRLPHD